MQSTLKCSVNDESKQSSSAHLPLWLLGGNLAECQPHQPMMKSVSQSTSQSTNQPVSQSISQPVSQSGKKSTSQPVSQSISHPVSQSVSQLVIQSVSHPVQGMAACHFPWPFPQEGTCSELPRFSISCLGGGSGVWLLATDAHRVSFG